MPHVCQEAVLSNIPLIFDCSYHESFDFPRLGHSDPRTSKITGLFSEFLSAHTHAGPVPLPQRSVDFVL